MDHLGWLVFLHLRATLRVVEVQRVSGLGDVLQYIFRFAQAGWQRSRGLDANQV